METDSETLNSKQELKLNAKQDFRLTPEQDGLRLHSRCADAQSSLPLPGHLHLPTRRCNFSSMSRTCPGASSCWDTPVNLTWEVPRRHPAQVSKATQLSLLEKWLCSEPVLNVYPECSCLHCTFPQCSFSQCRSLSIWGVVHE